MQMKDALGSVQSVLVLGGGSDIALATLRELVQRRAPHDRARGARSRVRSTAAADELRALGRDDGRDRRVRRRRHRRARRVRRRRVRARSATSTSCSLAFGVLGDQEEAEHDGRAAVDIAEVNYVGSVSVAVPIAQRHARRRATARSWRCRRSPASGPGARTSSTARRRPGMDAFFQGLGDSLVGTGVQVMIVRPGFVHTKMTEGMDAAPLSTTPEAVADAIVHGLARGPRDGLGARRRCAT